LLIPVLGIFALVVIVSSRYLINPITKCQNAMMEIRNNNFGITLENHYCDEIGGLIEGFNEMSSALVILRQKNVEIERQRREAEMTALEQKISPHFLYNTLEIINGFILDGQCDEAVRDCELLGQIYHYNLMNKKWVPLGDECEYIKKYLNIVQYKIKNLSLIWKVEKKILNTNFLKLGLQPLVENAILHGLRSKQSGACLAISIRSLQIDMLEICIMDNGSGFHPDKLTEIEETLSAIRRGIPLDSPHVGIPNVYQRLYMEYGGAMKFAIESQPGYGTKIVIVLPQKIAAMSCSCYK
jgi:two-component system sensor histidine kinase YesM